MEMHHRYQQILLQYLKVNKCMMKMIPHPNFRHLKDPDMVIENKVKQYTDSQSEKKKDVLTMDLLFNNHHNHISHFLENKNK